MPSVYSSISLFTRQLLSLPSLHAVCEYMFLRAHVVMALVNTT